MKQTLIDAAGNEIIVDDEVTLLGPIPHRSPDSHRDLKFQPIRFHEPQVQSAPKKQSGYSNPIDDPEWNAKHWPGNKPV